MNNANERIRQSQERLAASQREAQARLEERQRAAAERLAAMQASSRERTERLEQQARERQARLEELARSRQARLEEQARASQARAEERARDAQARAEERARTAQANAEARARAAQERAQQRASNGEQSFTGSFGYDDFAFEGLFNTLFGERARTSGASTPPPTRPRPTERISPAEATRRRMLSQMDPKMQRQVENYGSEFVTGFIGEVEAARQADPELTDWKIHLGYRKSIMAENPDPVDVEKVKLSDTLMAKVTPQGQPIPSAERAYPF